MACLTFLPMTANLIYSFDKCATFSGGLRSSVARKGQGHISAPSNSGQGGCLGSDF